MKLITIRIPIIHLLVFSLMLFVHHKTGAQTPSCVWVKNALGVQNDFGKSISIDPNGNIAVSGYFYSPSIYFDSTALTNNNSNTDIFVAKYNENGNVMWAKSAGGTNEDRALGVASDNSGNTYITGYFISPTIKFDSITLTNVFWHDIFLTKYDPLGNVVWAQSAGGSNWDDAYEVVTDPLGSVYIIGMFASASLTFGNITLNNTGGSADVFIAKYDSNGVPKWAKKATGTFGDAGYGIACDRAGNVYITGVYASSPFSLGGDTLLNDTTDQTPDVFISKLDSNGNVLWMNGINGKSRDESWGGITTDLAGNVYVTGFFGSDSLKIGPFILTNSNLATHDMFIAKYDSSGNEIWAQSAGSTGYDWAECITTDNNNNNVLVGGKFNSPAIAFGSTVLNNYGNGNTDGFLACYYPNGNINWAKNIGGTSADVCWGIAASNNDNIYFTGYCTAPQAFFDSETIISSGGSDMYIAKLSQTTAVEKSIFNNDLFTVFPNPSNGIINIDPGFTYIGLTDLYGKPIQVSMANSKIDLSNLPNGIYILDCLNKNGTKRNYKVVRE